MKTRESGMPEKELWDSFFDPEAILTALELTAETGDTVEFGCGHGTFALPAARRIHGTLYGFDIDPAMVEKCDRLAREEALRNVYFEQRDFMANGTGLPNEAVEYVMLFNILHAEAPDCLLREARRILVAGGTVAIIHWNYDASTPRGPPMSIRPRPEDCLRRLRDAGFSDEGDSINLPPYHYGLIGRKRR